MNGGVLNREAELRRKTCRGGDRHKGADSYKGGDCPAKKTQVRMRSGAINRKKWKAWGQMSDPPASQGCRGNYGLGNLM